MCKRLLIPASFFFTAVLLCQSDMKIPETKITILSDTPPQIDGKLDDVCWQKATVLSGFVISSKETKQARQARNKTEVFLIRDNKVLYVGARCYDASMGKMSKKDWFEVFIADKNLLVYYHFWIHPSGETGQDGSPGIFDMGQPQWHGSVSLYQDRWEVEIAIPFFNLSLEYLNNDTWRFNVCRVKYSDPPENSQWSNTGGYFHVPEKFGILRGMSGIDFTPSVDTATAIKIVESVSQPIAEHMLFDRLYYTSEKKARIRIFLSEKTLKDIERPITISLRLVSGDGKELDVKSFRGELRGSYLYLNLPVSDLANGNYTAEASVKMKNNQTISFSQTFTKLPPGQNEVKINRFTRTFLVNGEPFIPLILEVMFWGKKLAGKDTPDNALEIVAKESGFNVLIFWWNANEENIKLCDRFGTKVILFNMSEMTAAQKKGGQEAVTEKLIEIFKQYKNEPNLFAWFISDEGNLCADERHFKERFKRLKEVDPYHPIFRNDAGWVSGYGGPGGLESTDIYCGGYGGYRLIDTINIDAIPKGIPSLALSAWYGAPENPRYPTPDETIAWFYQLIIHGACGAFWWGTHEGKPPVPALLGAIRTIRNEADFLAPILNEEDPEIIINCNNPAVHLRTKKYNNSFYILSVNVTGENQKVSLKLDPAEFSKNGKMIVVFGEKDMKEITYRNWEARINYKPLQRLVFQIRN